MWISGGERTVLYQRQKTKGIEFYDFYCMYFKKKELSYIQVDEFKMTTDLNIVS